MFKSQKRRRKRNKKISIYNYMNLYAFFCMTDVPNDKVSYMLKDIQKGISSQKQSVIYLK